MINSFSQACTTFVGQNYGAGNLKRCKKTLLLCILEDAIASATTILIVLLSGKFLLSLFNNDPQVVETGYIRLVLIFAAYTFSMLYENMSGYLRGFGISLVPAILTVMGVRRENFLDLCGVPKSSHPYDHYAGISPKPFHNGIVDFYCTDDLSSVETFSCCKIFQIKGREMAAESTIRNGLRPFDAFQVKERC